MRNHTTLASSWLVLLGTFFVLGCNSDTPGAAMASQEDMLNEIEALSKAVSEAESAKDLELVLSYYSDDVVIHATNTPPIEGKEALRAIYEGVFAQELEYTRTTPETRRVSQSGDVAYEIGMNEQAIRSGDSLAVNQSKYIAVMHRIDDEWKTVFVSFSPNH